MNQKEFEIKDIPIMPQVAGKILQMQEENLQISFKELEKVVSLDPALTVKILKVANSALYARQKEITNLQQAITLLGFKMIKSLVLLVSASIVYGKQGKISGDKPGPQVSRTTGLGMWKHLLLTAFVGKYLAGKLGDAAIKEDVFIGGMLHDIGRVIILLNDPERYDRYIKILTTNPERDVLAVEEEIFGVNHTDVGEMALKKWSFPDELVSIVKYHHSAHVDSAHKRLVQIVGLANQYARMLAGEALTPEDSKIRKHYTHELALTKEIIEYIQGRLIEEIRKDELYIMSSSIL